MSLSMKIKEKSKKAFQYIRLESMFFGKNEFRKVHSEQIILWKKKFRQMIRYSSDRTFSIAEEFLSVKIDKISKKEFGIENEPILICALRNEIDKIRYFMEHYRRMGIKQFVILDNMSADGTFEYLLEQNDVALFRCDHPFTADRKIAWMNRLIAEYGINHWYLMVDSDEFVTYLEASERTIQELIFECEKREYKRVGGAMLDMYPKDNLFQIRSNINFLQRCCYLDRDTYSYSKAANGIRITGGPRKRIFGTGMKLSKYCLFYFEKDDIIPSAHFLIPFEKGFDVPIAMAILHYKFVNESDYEKIIEAVQTGMHSDNSAEYKTYLKGIEDNTQLTFYDELYSMLYSEENLRQISFLESCF